LGENLIVRQLPLNPEAFQSKNRRSSQFYKNVNRRLSAKLFQASDFLPTEGSRSGV